MTTNQNRGEHTPEPWFVLDQWPTVISPDKSKPRGGSVIPEQNTGYAREICIMHDNVLNRISPEEAKANARRIAACVNACKGVSTEVLETAAIGPNAEEWFRDWSALPAEAHELGVKEWAESVQRKNQELARHLENLVSLSECYCRSTFKQKQKDKCLVCKARAALSPSGPQEA